MDHSLQRCQSEGVSLTKQHQSDLDMVCSQKTIRYSCQKTKWFRWMFKLGGVALEAILDKVLYGRSSQGREHGGHSSQFP